MRELPSAPRAVAAAGVALGGFLAGRRGFEALVAFLQHQGLGPGLAGAVAGPVYLAFAAALALAALRLLPARDRLADHLPEDRAPIQLAAGFGLGAAVVLVTLAVELASGRAELAGLAPRGGLVRSLGTGLVELGAIAAAEELVFRLALLQVAARLFPWPVAVGLSSAAYAAVHAGGGRTWPIYLASLLCFGIVACQLRVLGGSLWLPVGAHAAWDFGSFAAFESLPLALRGPTWLTGLPFQLSAGLVMLLVLAAASGALALGPGARGPGPRSS